MFKQKKILAFSMLLIMAVHLIFFIGFVVKERMIKNEMRANLETSSLKTITVNEADVQWVEENKEVIINGNLFDVKSHSIADGKITLTGLFDNDESKLNKEFANLIHQKKDKSAPLNQLILKFISTTAINKTTASIPTPFSKSVTKVYPDFNEVTVNQSSSVTTPPPNA